MSIFKNKSNSLFITTFSFCFILIFGSQTIAQQRIAERKLNDYSAKEYSAKELRAFVKANKKVVAIQSKSEKKIKKAIKKAGLTVKLFNEIIASKQNPQQESTFSEDEMSSFNKAGRKILLEHRQTEKEIIQSIESEGLNVNTYEEMMYAYEQSPKVQEKVKMILEDN